MLSEGVYTLRPEEYIPILKSLGVTCIVRFNTKCYDRMVYVNAGIRHVDLYYEDGGNPTDAILQVVNPLLLLSLSLCLCVLMGRDGRAFWPRVKRSEEPSPSTARPDWVGRGPI